MSAESHLSLFGVSVEQANDFILSHVTEPQVIFDAASQLGIPTSMLSEITDYSTDVISDYFQEAGLDSSELDQGSLAGKRELITKSAALFFDDFIVFNDNTGDLSTDSLREGVIAKTNANDYFAFFNPENFKGAEDGVFTPEELSIEHLGDIPATTENLESLYYGSFISLFRTIDEDEFWEFFELILSNPDILEEDFEPTSDEAIQLVNILKDPAEKPFFNNVKMAIFAIDVATEEVNLVGIQTGLQLFEEALI